MSVHDGQGPPTAWIERLTSTMLFAVLFGISIASAVLLLLAGLALVPMLLVSADSVWSMFPLGLIAGGVVGIVGLVRSRRHALTARSGSVERTMICLMVGIAAALVVVGYLVIALSELPRFDGTEVLLGSILAVPHAILILAGIGSMQRLKRRYAADAGEPFDTLPVIFFLLALALAVGVLVGTGLTR
jgi:hypothetical protein